MNIRIRGNSIRYRLDITTLQEQQEVKEATTIGAGELYFSILSCSGEAAIQLASASVQLSLPTSQIQQWANTTEVGDKLQLPNPDGSVLQLLVEKDFKCFAEREKDQSQAFDNPAQSC